jgi:hypothetical protein
MPIPTDAGPPISTPQQSLVPYGGDVIRFAFSMASPNASGDMIGVNFGSVPAHQVKLMLALRRDSACRSSLCSCR